MLTLALALALALADPAPAIVPSVASRVQDGARVDEVPRTWAWVGSSIGPRFTEGGVGMVELGVSYRLVDWLEPEAVIGIGAHAILDAAAPQRAQIVDRFSFGARIVAPLVDEGEAASAAVLRPFLWLALHHEHQAEWAAMLKNPIGTTLGVSSEGVAHYTGMEAGLGSAVAFRVDETPLQAMLRVNVVYLPALGGSVLHTDGSHSALGDQLALLVDVTAGLPLAF